MSSAVDGISMARNIVLYPWFKFFQSLVFWQAVWFLYFQKELSASEAILLYAVYDIATTALEVPSGYMSDRLGRRPTLIMSAAAGCIGTSLLVLGDSFEAFALGQIFVGASAAFASGTDSALLYESLAADKREDEIEAQELRAWRFSFVGLAISAVLGGVMALSSYTLPFLGAALAYLVAVLIAFALTEPSRAGEAADSQGSLRAHFNSLRETLQEPVLMWIFILSVLMYGFSHIPFVFGQPFILEAMNGIGLEGETPLASGLVSALMMVLSLGTSLFALRLRQWLGLPQILLLAFFLQIALVGVLALTNSVVAIVFLLFRMVPNSISQPFILARIQPLLSDENRATYLSLQGFVGRLAFAATLILASLSTVGDAPMPYDDIQQIATWFVAGGIVCVIVLALMTRRIAIDNQN